MNQQATNLAKSPSRHHTRMIAEGAVMVAWSQALSYVKFVQFPQGGSLTLAMFPVLFFAFRWGLSSGLMAGFVFGLMQLLFDGAYAWAWQSMLLDYLLAYTPLGLCGLFKGKKLGIKGIYFGILLGCFGRFLVHWLSGVTIYASYMPEEFFGVTMTSPAVYSTLYNGSYMLPNTILALFIAGLLQKPLRKYFMGEDILEMQQINNK